eukprot:jgi/Botrbrau1/10360/Bobra.0321s0034.2
MPNRNDIGDQSTSRAVDERDSNKSSNARDEKYKSFKSNSGLAWEAKVLALYENYWEKLEKGSKHLILDRNLSAKEWQKFTNDLVYNKLFLDGVTKEMVYTWIKNARARYKKKFAGPGRSGEGALTEEERSLKEVADRVFNTSIALPELHLANEDSSEGSGSQISTIDADNEDCDDFSGDFSDPYDEENVNSLTPLDGSRTAPSTHGKTGSRGDPPVQTEEQEGTATSPFKKRAARSRKGGHACSLETPKPVDKHITGKRIAREKKSAPGLDDAVTKIAAASQAVGGFLESWPTTYQKSQQLAAEAQKPTPEDKALELRAEFAKRKLQGEPVGMTLEELEDYINKFILPQSSKAPNSIDGTRDEVVLLDDSPPRAKKVAAARGKPTGKSA